MGKAEQRRRDKANAVAKADERRRVVLRVYQGCDEAGTRKLAELAATGIVPTCAMGCAHCCNLEIPISRAEGETIVAWLGTERTAEEVDTIRDRLRAWLVWYRTEYPKLIASGMSRVDVFFKHAPGCALLEQDNRCGAYPVRPISCRNHYVKSPVSECNPAIGSGDPDVLLEVARATYDHVIQIRQLIERQGGDHLASIHLLPEWLAHLLEVEREPWRDAPRLQLS